MVPDAFGLREKYGTLAMPVVIVAGGADRLVDTERQSGRLRLDVDGSSFHPIPGAGHMVHQTATDEVLAAIDEAPAAGGLGLSRAAEGGDERRRAG